MTRRTPRSESDWRRAHDELSRLARLRAGLDAEEGLSLLRAERCRVHAELGYGSFAEYIERLFGYDAQTTREKLRVAGALEELPALYRALSSGEISWSAVRELTRVATADNETEWLTFARGKTVRQVEKQVAGRQRGARPGDPADPKVERHVLRFDVSAETLATFREAMDKLRRDTGSSLDDDAALLLMARHVLGGPTDEGRASYQVLVNVCEALIRIDTLEVIRGPLPSRALSLVVEWALAHRQELHDNWGRAERGEPLVSIDPLE